MQRVASIYQHILQHLDPHGSGLLPQGELLPDEGFVSEPRRYPPGARDQVGRRLLSVPGDVELPPIMEALERLCQRPGKQSRRRLEATLRTRRCIDLVDPLLKAVRQSSAIVPDVLYAEIRHLLVETHWREAVKWAIALMGMYRREADAPLLETLAQHGEFTFFAVVALGHTLPDPLPVFLRLLRQVKGWGRVHVVRRLLDQTLHPDVRTALILHGVTGTTEDIYLAPLVAERCRLHETLRARSVPEEVLHAARALLSAMFLPGPAPVLARYEHGAEAAALWLRHVSEREPYLPCFLTASQLALWAEQPTCPWGREEASEVASLARSYLDLPVWTELAQACLAHPDRGEARAAREVARRLNLPVFDQLLPALEHDPTDTALWQYLTTGATQDQMERLLKAVRPPAGEVLTTLLVGLRRFPGIGGALLISGLQSGAPLHRLQALDVLGRWPAAMVPAELAFLVLRLSQEDEQGVVRKAAGVVYRAWKKPGAS